MVKGDIYQTFTDHGGPGETRFYFSRVRNYAPLEKFCLPTCLRHTKKSIVKFCNLVIGWQKIMWFIISAVHFCAHGIFKTETLLSKIKSRTLLSSKTHFIVQGKLWTDWSKTAVKSPILISITFARSKFWRIHSLIQLLTM